MRQLLVPLTSMLLLCGCQVGDASIFVANTYHQPSGDSIPLGKATARVCQRYWLYLMPSGEAPTTRAALDKALAVRPGTRYLADMSVDNQMEIGIGYLDDCILVEGIAHGTEVAP